VVEKSEKDKEKEVRDVSGNMMEVLENSDNPKWRNCKMLKFLKKLNTGAYYIKDDTLIKDEAKIAEFKEYDQQRMEQEKIRVAEEESK
jgi:hypothetical protein